jgi:hypothetical protein
MSTWIAGIHGYRDEKYKTLFRNECLSEDTVTAMDTIPAANNQSYFLNVGGCETWILTDSQKDDVKLQLETALNLNLTIIHGSIKRWFRPSQIHTDGSSADYDYSVIIPISFTPWSDSVRPPATNTGKDWTYWHGDDAKAPTADDGPGAYLHSTITGTPSVTIDSDGGYHQNNFGTIKKKGKSLPLSGPGLVLYDAEWNENVILLDREAVSTASGRKIKNDLVDLPTQVKDRGGEATGPDGGSAFTLGHVAKKFRVIPIRHYIPWAVGSVIAFKPELLHSSTNWLSVGKYKTHLFLTVKINANG